MFEMEDIERQAAKIRVIGVGGGGGNAINSMIAANIYGIEFIAVNTDKQHLDLSIAPMKVQIGVNLTKGLGAGANPTIGRDAAYEDRDSLVSCVEGADMLFITAGMGGGTGTGAAPVIAGIAKELGILTIGVVTKPFYYEGRQRALKAEEGIRDLKKNVDALIVIPNDRIHQVVDKGTPLLKSFFIANDVLRQAVQGISDLILVQGLINLDFADVRAVIENSGKAVIGSGRGKGDAGAFEAAKKAISNHLIEEPSIEGAKGILINITGGLTMTLDAVQAAASLIHDSAHEDANIILGAVINTDMEDEVAVTVIATGLEDRSGRADLEIRKWSPVKENVSLRATKGILDKNMPASLKEQHISKPVEKKEVLSPAFVAQDARVDGVKDPHADLQKVYVENTARVNDAENHTDAEQDNESKNSNNPAFTYEDDFDVPTFLREKNRE